MTLMGKKEDTEAKMAAAEQAKRIEELETENAKLKADSVRASADLARNKESKDSLMSRAFNLQKKSKGNTHLVSVVFKGSYQNWRKGDRGGVAPDVAKLLVGGDAARLVSEKELATNREAFEKANPQRDSNQ